MHRFFSPHTLTKTLKITEWDLFHQISHVFRSRKWGKFIFFEDGWEDIIYILKDISRKEVVLIESERVTLRGKWKSITMFQAFPNKIQTMELIVQKLVEIGIREIIFFKSNRSQLREVPQQKQERIKSISIEALEQSGNNQVPNIHYSSKSITELMGEYKNLAHIIGSPNGPETISKTRGEIALWIGPEGGWSEEELSEFQSQGSLIWSFSKNILRLETASIVGAGILSYLSDMEV